MASERRQKIRGSTLELDQEIGLEGLLAYDTELRNIRLFDGVTLGGMKILNEAQIAALYTLPQRLTDDGDTAIGLSANSKITNGWYRTDATTTDLPVAAVGVLEVAVADAASGAISQIWTRNSTGFKYFRSKTGGGAWQAWQRFVDLNFLTTDPTAKAYDADRLDGQDSTYYTDIPARLGYTPLNKAGDGITGNLTVGGTLGVTGNTTLTGTLGVTAAATFNGGVTSNGVVSINGSGPTLKLSDTDASKDDFWAHANDDVFYVLTDRDDDAIYDGSNPLELRNATATIWSYGNQVVTKNMYGHGGGINADLLDGVEGAGYVKTGDANFAGRAYPRRSDGVGINFIWSDIGEYSYYWGGSDAVNMYVTARQSMGVGGAQYWQNVAPSRGVGGVYQNAVGKPIMVSIQGNDSSQFWVSVNASAWLTIGTADTDQDSGGHYTGGIIIPHAHYYTVQSAGFGLWAELRP